MSRSPVLAYDSADCSPILRAAGVRIERHGCPLIVEPRRRPVADAALPLRPVASASPAEPLDRAAMLREFPHAFRLEK